MLALLTRRLAGMGTGGVGDELFVTVSFSDGHRQHWRLPDGQTPEQALEELRQVIVTGQWFRAPDSTKAYSPHAIVAVDVAPRTDTDPSSIAFRLGEVVGDAISPDPAPRLNRGRCKAVLPEGGWMTHV